MKRLLTLLLCFTLYSCYDYSWQSSPAHAIPTSTIDPAKPALNAPITSALLRNQYVAAYNDINALWIYTYTQNAPATSGQTLLAGNGSGGFSLVTVGSGLNYNTSTSTLTGTGVPGGTNGQVQYNNAGVLAGFVVSGDCTLVVSTGVMTCLKTNGVNFAASATTDTTNAANISSGVLAAARLPNPSATTLGGVQSKAALTHFWLTSISTAGVPVAAQPDYSDLTGTPDLSIYALKTTTVNGHPLSSNVTVSASDITTGTLPAGQLPNPTATTLGGIESYAAVSNQWIRSISTSGVPASSQPACVDLSNAAASCSTDTTNAANISSGTLPAGRLPNPSATTLGGIQSITATSHNFLTSISTSGVPAKAQPVCADISDAGTACTAASSSFEVPLTFSTGLTRSTNTVTVNTSQNISTLSNLVTNGFVTTSGSAGTLGVDTATYVPTSRTVAGKALSSNITIACSDLSNGASGCSTATGTSGATIPLLNGTNTVSGVNTHTANLNVNLNVTALPAAQAGTVLQLANVDSTATRLEVDSFAQPSFFTALRYNGTNASKTALTTSDQIGGYNGWGYDGTAAAGPVSSFRSYAAQPWTTSNHGAYADIATTPNNSTTLTGVMRFEQDGGVTVPSTVTGGDEGLGTINATGLYIGGVSVNNASTFTAGTLGAGRLPNPSASTLGGIQSYAAVTNQWIKSISTSGVPASTRPACADLSDSVASCSTDATNASNLASGTLPAARIGTWGGDLSGSATMSPTVAKVNGIAYSATAAAHTVEVITSANTTATAKTIPDCTDSAGNHLNYTQSTDAFSCGTTIPTKDTKPVFLMMGSSAPTVAQQGSYVTMGCAGTLDSYDISVNAGTMTVKFWKSTSSTASPTTSNSINTSGVALSSNTHIHSTTLSDFTSTTFSAGDTFGGEVTATSGVTQWVAQVNGHCN